MVHCVYRGYGLRSRLKPLLLCFALFCFIFLLTYLLSSDILIEFTLFQTT